MGPVKDVSGQEGGVKGLVEDAIDIGLAAGRVTGVKAFMLHRSRPSPCMSGGRRLFRPLARLWSPIPFSVTKIDHLTQRVHTTIGAGSCVYFGLVVQDLLDGLPQPLLDGYNPGLPLPAMIVCAVIRNYEGIYFSRGFLFGGLQFGRFLLGLSAPPGLSLRPGPRPESFLSRFLFLP